VSMLDLSLGCCCVNGVPACMGMYKKYKEQCARPVPSPYHTTRRVPARAQSCIDVPVHTFDTVKKDSIPICTVLIILGMQRESDEWFGIACLELYAHPGVN